MSSRNLRLIAASPVELLVYDEPTNCPYLPEETARLPMRLPSRPLSRQEFAERLDAGDRRQGIVLYRPSCPNCQACEAIRLDVESFEPNKSQRRVLRRGKERFRIERGAPVVDALHVALYNRHKLGRSLLGDGDPIDASSYHAFLVESCTDSFEMRYYVGDDLVGVAVVDQASDALSAVYTYFDPDFERDSPGTYSVLEQVELCRALGLRYLYLGLYVQGCSTMRYKTTFFPHQRRLQGTWHSFERSETGEASDARTSLRVVGQRG